MKELWYPCRNSAHGKHRHRHADGGIQIGLVAGEAGNSAGIHRCFQRFAGATLRFAHPENKEYGQYKAGDGAGEEGHLPAVAFADHAAGEVAEGGADGDGEVEDAEDAVAVFFGVEVREQGGCEDAEAGLADAESGVAEVEGEVGVDRTGEEVAEAPKDDAGDDEGLARETVAEPAGERRGEHVGDEEPEGERAHLRVGGREAVVGDSGLDKGEFAGEEVAVYIVEEIY